MKIAVVVLLIAGLTGGNDVLADERDDAAKAAFDKGVRQYRAGKPEAAAEAFREALRLRPSYALWYNIGQSETAAKRYGLGFEAFETYLAEGGDELSLGRRNEVLKELERLEQMVGAIKVTAPADALVTVDSIPRGTAPLPGTLKVAAGVLHRVEVILEGEVIHSESVKVSRKETAAFEVANQPSFPTATEHEPASAPGTGLPTTPASSEPAHPPAPDRRNRRPFKIAGSALLGAGGALLVGGAVTGGLAIKINADLGSSCTAGVCTTSGEQDDLERRDSLSSLSTALLSAGGVAATAGLTFLIVYLRGKQPKGDERTVNIVPVLDADNTGLGIAGRF